MNNKASILLIICPPAWEKLPPQGPAILSEYLQERGHGVLFFDLNLKMNLKLGKVFQKDWTINRNYTSEGFYNHCFQKFPELFEEIISIIKKESIQYIGFTVLNSNRKFSLKLSELIKSKIPQSKIIFGGPEVFSMEIEGFAGMNHVDFFVTGEGEKALQKIIEGKSKDRIIKFMIPEIIDFYPSYKNFDIKGYPDTKRIPIIASRGCYNKCSFCSERLLYPSYRFRNPLNIIEEIRHHFINNRINSFIFYDSIFNGNLKLFDILLDLIIQSGVNISWEAQAAVRDDMSPEIFEKMKRSGCVNLFIGLESGSDKILRLMNKPFDSANAMKFFEKLKRAGLRFEVSLIANYPGETEKEFLETMDFIKSTGHIINKIAQISLYRKYPGTNTIIPVDYSEEEGYIKINRLTGLLKENNIRYTPSYINNLI